MDKQEAINSLKTDGYYVYHQKLENPNELVQKARDLCSSKEYERGGDYRSNLNQIDTILKDIVYTECIKEVFAEFDASPQDIFITYENKTGVMTRNNFLHFDRYRCMKALVYLEDTDENCGPFTIVEKSHTKGVELRRRFINQSNYESIKNRIDIDYPEIENKLKPIVGPAGTTILFDTDLFHMGGSIEEGRSRTVIRAHWYKDAEWRKK